MKYLKLAAALMVAVFAMALASSSATAATAPGFEEFQDCPDRTVDPAITACVSTVVDGGHLKLGSKDTPIVDPITLSGAIKPGGTGGTFIVGSFDGGRQPVPGGLVGITGLDWLIYLFPNEVLGLYAEAELAGTPTSPLAEPLHLPLKVQLHNVLLADGCYIGSNSNPINLVLTQGTTNPPPPNQPITGNPGTLAPDPSVPGLLRVTDLVLVDNAFAAPAAQGCDLTFLGLVNTLVNLQAGLPAPAGTNTAVQEADAAFASVLTVFPPSGIEQ
jgi:hypothetical protein